MPVQASPLFTLPAELRNRIYQLLNAHSHCSIRSTQSHCSSSSSDQLSLDEDDDEGEQHDEDESSHHHRKAGPSPEHAWPSSQTIVPLDRLFRQPGFTLTRVSRQLRVEATPVFYSSNVFKFYLCFAPPRWLDRVEPRFLAFIAHIVLEDYQTDAWHPTPVCQSRIEIDLTRAAVVVRPSGSSSSLPPGIKVENDDDDDDDDDVGPSSAVRKFTDPRCRECVRRQSVVPAKLIAIVADMVADAAKLGPSSSSFSCAPGITMDENARPKCTRDRLLQMFDAARFNYALESASTLAGSAERLIS